MANPVEQTPAAEAAPVKENWFESLNQNIHERVDEVVAFLKAHNSNTAVQDVESIVKDAVAEFLSGDSFKQIVSDSVKSAIKDIQSAQVPGLSGGNS